MIIFIHGPDTYSSEQYLGGVIRQFRDKHGQAVSFFNGEEASWENLAAELTASGLFGGKKLIVVKNILENKDVCERLQAFLKGFEIAKDITFVIYHSGAPDRRTGLVKKLLKEKMNKEFGETEDRQVEDLIHKELSSAGKSIEQPAMRVLVSVVGNDLRQAQAEASKLAHLPAQTITAEIVKANTIASIQDDIWQFVDALSSGDKSQALNLLERQFLSGAEPMYLLSMIIRQVRLLITLHKAQGTDSALAAELSLHPFVVKKTRAQSRQFSLPHLVAIYQALTRLDAALKSGKGEPKLLFTILVDSIVHR